MSDMESDLQYGGFFSPDVEIHGFAPINVPKRSLTPTTAASVPVPSKRIAIRPLGDDDARQNPLSSSSTIDFSSKGSVDTVHTSNLVSPTSTYGIPESLPGTSLPHVKIGGPSLDDEDVSWMDEFVDLGQGDNQNLISFTQISGGYHEAESQELSSPRTIMRSEELGNTAKEDLPPLEDDYGLDDSDEEDMMQLAEHPDAFLPRAPPTSVIQQMDRDSRSPASFDSQLQHSTPAKHHRSDPGGSFTEPDFLDEDVDWDLVAVCAKKVPTSPAEVPSAQVTHPHRSAPSAAAFARPPFPVKIRDRSVVVRLSSTIMLRTCFRIGELLNAHTRCSRNKQDVTFELFARVTYSSRESTARTQHFQLKDLFTEQQPFISSMLKGWTAGGLIDEQNKVFLGQGGKNKLCRCICKLSDDPKSSTGRSAAIMSIRETDWDEIQWALRIVARDAASGDDGFDEVTSEAT